MKWLKYQFGAYALLSSQRKLLWIEPTADTLDKNTHFSLLPKFVSKTSGESIKSNILGFYPMIICFAIRRTRLISENNEDTFIACVTDNIVCNSCSRVCFGWIIAFEKQFRKENGFSNQEVEVNARKSCALTQSQTGARAVFANLVECAGSKV